MKKIISILSLILFACSSENTTENTDNSIATNVSVLIAPNTIDVNYASTDEKHYVVRNTKNHANKLLLFIGGSFSIPKDYNIYCDQAATFGLDVISLSYPNGVGTATLGNNNDIDVFKNYRDEICLGNQVSNVIAVDLLNCIVTRTTKLILYLKNNYPDQNWNQYLTANNIPVWSKIIVAGHSQGSGHACYLGKKFLTDKVIMFAGPNDYHTFYNAPANWLSTNGLTPISKHFALLHTQDEIVSYANQVSNLRSLGILGANENPVLADNLTSPYQNKNVLSLNILANSNHSSPIGANAILPNIWTYFYNRN